MTFLLTKKYSPVKHVVSISKALGGRSISSTSRCETSAAATSSTRLISDATISVRDRRLTRRLRCTAERSCPKAGRPRNQTSKVTSLCHTKADIRVPSTILRKRCLVKCQQKVTRHLQAWRRLRGRASATIDKLSRLSSNCVCIVSKVKYMMNVAWKRVLKPLG